MSEHANRRIHWSFWLIAAIALVWNLLGSINFFAQMDPEILESYRASERAIVEGRPGWATAGFALAVFGGTLGSLVLLLRKAVAQYFFIASLLGVLVTMVHALGSDIAFGAGEIAGIIVMPLAVAGFLVWYARLVSRRGWVA